MSSHPNVAYDVNGDQDFNVDEPPVWFASIDLTKSPDELANLNDQLANLPGFDGDAMIEDVMRADRQLPCADWRLEGHRLSITLRPGDFPADERDCFFKVWSWPAQPGGFDPEISNRISRHEASEDTVGAWLEYGPDHIAIVMIKRDT